MAESKTEVEPPSYEDAFVNAALHNTIPAEERAFHSRFPFDQCLKPF